MLHYTAPDITKIILKPIENITNLQGFKNLKAMKTKSKFSIALLLLMAVLTITGCKKNPPPPPPPPPPPTPVPATVTIKNYDHLTMSGVTVNYTILVNDSKISEAGVLFSTKTDSTTAQKLPATSVNQTMSSFLTGL